ncbi:MAG: TIGR02996 domain-containing protein [Aureliella sp.]
MYSSLLERYREEQAFIREILFEPTDLSIRLVYADWLDERQDPRAGLLRIDVELQELSSDDPRRTALLEERRQLLPSLDWNWISLLAMAPIERCPGSIQRTLWPAGQDSQPERIEFQYRCPKRWENLKPGEEADNVRFCNECEHNVYYCFNLKTAREHAERRNCVALDPVVPRKRYDLDYIPESDLDIRF